MRYTSKAKESREKSAAKITRLLLKRGKRHSGYRGKGNTWHEKTLHNDSFLL